MNGLNLTDILTAIAAHQYLALVIIVIAYLRTLVDPANKFPVNIPVAWQPVVTIILGGVYSLFVAHQNGAAWGAAAIAAVVVAGGAGLADAVLVAVYVDPTKAPWWAKLLVNIFDALTKRGAAAKGGGAAVLILAVGCSTGLLGCKAFLASRLPDDLQAEEECVVAEIEKGDLAVAGIAVACFQNEIVLAEDAIALLLGSQAFTKSHASVIPTLKSNLSTSRGSRASQAAK